jgi:hypothetical protein
MLQAAAQGVVEDGRKVLAQIVKTMEDKVAALKAAPAHGERSLNVGEMDVGAGGAQGDPKKNQAEIAKYESAIGKIKGIAQQL